MPQRHPPIFLRLLARGWPYRTWLAIVILTTAGTSVAMVAGPWLVGRAIDIGFDINTDDGSFTVGGDMSTIAVAAGLLLVAAVLRGAFSYAQTYVGEQISQGVAYDLRNDIFDHLQHLSFAYHDEADTGQIMSRATQDVEAIRMFVGMGVVRLLSLVVLLGVAGVLMVQTNVKVAVVALAFMPVVAAQATIVGVLMRPIWLRVMDLHGQISNVLQENLTGIRVVKAFSREEHEQQKFDVRADALFQASYKASVIQAVTDPLMVALWMVSNAVVFWVGGIEVQNGAMSAGDLVAFLLYLNLLQMPVRILGFIVNMFARAHSAGSRVYEILDAESAVQERPDAKPLRADRGEVVFEHVAFGYDTLSSVLHDVNIHARPGEVVALLGPTGCGKSTVVNLLPRFYDVTEGSITIDGQDVRDVTLDSLRESIGIVQQDVYLFPATIAENIAYGRPDATQEEVIEASKAARMHDFIDSLPDGYMTWVGERGVTLSGGQRQRIAIARMLLLDPRVLIFDDSTSSVDMRTEYLIQEALQNLMEGRTTFVIAQRLRTVQQADQILIMRDGTIVEHGTHEQLLEQGGLYREIYDLELRDQEEARAGVIGETGDG